MLKIGDRVKFSTTFKRSIYSNDNTKGTIVYVDYDKKVGKHFYVKLQWDGYPEIKGCLSGNLTKCK